VVAVVAVAAVAAVVAVAVEVGLPTAQASISHAAPEVVARVQEAAPVRRRRSCE
jgi:hypothetical protein